MNDINVVVKGPLRKLLNDSIAINSTAFEGEDEHGGHRRGRPRARGSLLALAVVILLGGMSVLLIYADIVNPIDLFG